MVRKYRRKKLLKVGPQVEGGIEIVRCAEYLLVWKPAPRVPAKAGRQARPAASGVPRRPKPKRWANLTLFLFDVEKRKRSYRLAWNGERMAVSAEAVALAEREPGVWEDLHDRLEGMGRVICSAQADARKLARDGRV